jgi:hypothetical protein
MDPLDGHELAYSVEVVYSWAYLFPPATIDVETPARTSMSTPKTITHTKNTSKARSQWKT